MKQIIKIKLEQKDQRIDKFLSDFDSEKSRSFWQNKIKSGEVLVNEERIKTNYSLKENDFVIILPDREKEKREIVIPKIDIIYEDSDVIVIDKPAGVNSQSADSSSAPSVTDFILRHYPEIKGVGEEEQRFGIVHRLDQNTSGIMIIAKNNNSFNFLKDKFKNREVEKIYTALVYGKVDPKEGEINLEIGRSKKNPTMQTVIDSNKKKNIKARNALTLYKTIRNYQDYSLLEVQIKTGRMHQIRVHFKSIGYPVVGDPKYNFKRFLKEDKLSRQFLHASKLEIRLPNGENKEFFSSLPQDLEDFLKQVS